MAKRKIYPNIWLGKLLKALIFWGSLTVFIYFIPPVNIMAFLIFYILFFLALSQSLEILISRKRSIVWALLVAVYLVTRQLHIANIINTMILIAIFITAEVYFRKGN